MVPVTFQSTSKGSENIASLIALVVVALIVAFFGLMILAGIFMVVLAPAAAILALALGITKNPEKSS
jgi:hypothetical protein